MGVITISPKAALRREFIEKTIIAKMNPQLYFLNIFPVVDLKGASTFQYFRDDESAEDDIQSGKMSTPLVMSELGKMSKIEVSPITKQIGDTYEFGYKLEFSKRVTRENGFIDEILRAYDRAAYGISRKINYDILENMDTFATAPSITLNDGSWDNSSAIAEDIIDMQKSFDQVGWDYNLTDMYTHKEQYYQTKKFYTAIDGSFNPKDVEGSNFNNAKNNLEEGTLFGIDKNIKPITIYKNVDPDLAKAKGNDMVNVNIFDQQEYPRKHIIEIMCEMGVAVKHPKAILKQTGL